MLKRSHIYTHCPAPFCNLLRIYRHVEIATSCSPLWRERGRPCPLFPTSILGAFPLAKQPPGSGWKPSPGWELQCPSHRRLDRSWRSWGCSSAWWQLPAVSVSGISGKGPWQGFLICLTNGVGLCPQVSCLDEAAGVRIWPGKVPEDSDPHLHCVWIHFNQLWCALQKMDWNVLVSYRAMETVVITQFLSPNSATAGLPPRARFH
jgi:DNA-binding transcriptional LysR family regulator